jgi:chlorite dismutase
LKTAHYPLSEPTSIAAIREFLALWHDADAAGRRGGFERRDREMARRTGNRGRERNRDGARGSATGREPGRQRRPEILQSQAMKSEPPAAGSAKVDSSAAPLTLEGTSLLHQMFRIRRAELRRLAPARRQELAHDAAAAIGNLQHEDGESAAFSVLGHKGDLLLIHFRADFEELSRAEAALAALAISDYLEPASSYLSMIEIGLYEASVRLYQRLAAAGVEPGTPQWREAIDAALKENREKLAMRLWPRIPERRYLCFYPMNKRRGETRNWYRLPIEDRQRLMHDHGMIGRRYAGQVTQIISGSVGFDDWEWGVDLFADDPLVFKKLVYEMRFDESSAFYAEFGPFYVGIRLKPEELAAMIADGGG